MNHSNTNLNIESEIIIYEYISQNKKEVTSLYQFIINYLTFNLGTSWMLETSVVSEIFLSLKKSFSISFSAILVNYIFSLYFSYIYIYYKNVFTKYVYIILVVLYLVPPFVSASILSGDSKILNIMLATLVLASSNILFTFLFIKSMMSKELGKTSYHFAKIQSSSSIKVLHKNVIPNLLFFIVADLGLFFIYIVFGSSIFVETVLNINGFAMLNYNAIVNYDIPIIIGSIYLVAVIGILFRLVGDTMRYLYYRHKNGT